MVSQSGGSLCVYFCIWSNTYTFYKSGIIYGTHCQRIVQFLTKVEKFMEEKKIYQRLLDIKMKMQAQE